ncbi:hypothetical protein HanPSC8_Chr14g0641171 [Helianthus annuus]|nr:hypothetical protein HanPSC8_Chr14g0641171 [Helianthus annuus]
MRGFFVVIIRVKSLTITMSANSAANMGHLPQQTTITIKSRKMNPMNMTGRIITSNASPSATVTILTNPRTKSIGIIYDAILELEKCLSLFIYA